MTDLNIKIPEAHQLAKELSEMTGESMARATTEALRERRDRLSNGQSERARRFRRLAEEIGRELPDEMMEGDPTEVLYDEDGLPVGN